jgi:exopolyphosphatase/guanosine-5'-triphosphate,3'-diphosphate pyrophosphatase
MMINKLDLYSIEKIGVLLRIAEGLDRSLEGSISDLNISIVEDSVKIKLFSDNDLYLEIHQALRSKDRFFEIYRKNLLIEKEDVSK